MNDIIQYAELDNPQKSIDVLNWPDSTLMYLEKMITGWLSPDLPHAPQVAFFDPDTEFREWERGRVFCADFELRWEKVEEKFQMVYVGNPITLDGFTQAIDLAQTQAESTTYYLWGRRVAKEDLGKIGVAHEPESHGIFIQMRVPTHLYYPVQHEKTNRVKLKVCHYRHQETGQILYHRYLGLEEEFNESV